MAVSTIDPNGLNIGQIGGTRNLVQNGSMIISQRGTSFSSLTASQYCLDRFSNDIGGGGAITVAQSTTTPADFKNSMSLTVATNDASIGAADAYRITHAIEGQNAAHLNWGTSDARTVVLSFWVRSSVTGTYGLGLANSAETENYIAEYTISAANTWEYKTITIEGRTSGTWLDTNGVGIGIRWDLGSGTNYNGTAGTWQTTGSKVYRTSSCVNWIATSGATFYLTGVQLEVGDTATPFEHRSYGQELALCQRYFWRSTGDNYFAIGSGQQHSATQSRAFIPNPVYMRAAPTISISGTLRGNSGGSTVDVTTINDSWSGLKSNMVQFTTSGFSTGNGFIIHHNNNSSNYLQADAEL